MWWNIFSDKKINKLSGHKKTWRNFKCMLLKKNSQPEKATHCTILTIWYYGKGKTIELEGKKKKSMVSQVQEEGNRNELVEHRVLLGFMKVFCVILYWDHKPLRICQNYNTRVFPHSSVSRESAHNAGDLSSIPGSGRSSGEGNATHSSILA